MTPRPPVHRRWGIAHIMVTLLVVMLAPFIVLEVYRGGQDVARRRAAVTERARAQADEQAYTMDDFVRLTERFLATLAGAPQVQEFNANGAAALFHAARRANPNYENVFLLADDGTQVASTEPLVRDPTVTERPYFQDAMRTGRLAISGVLAWPGTGRSVVVLAYPVIAPQGQHIGVVAVALNIARLSDVIGQAALPSRSVVLLAQSDGNVIAASERPETWVGQTLAGSAVLERAGSGGTATTGVVVDGVERVYGYRSLSRAPWLLLAGIPQSEVDAALRLSVIRVVQQLALAGVATTVLCVLLLRRVVVPIRVLSEGARAFAGGYLNRRIPLRRNDELGDLSDALNSMATSLGERLEKEVAHNEALRGLNQLQAEFVATASHELRTPITAIRSYAEALLRPDITDEETRRDCLEGIDRSSARLARLVRALLDVSRIDSGSVRVTLDEVDAVALARAATAQAAPNEQARVQLDAAPGLPAVRADRDRLEDAVGNLIVNALKFSPATAPVTVRLRRGDGEVTITVADRGIGIAADELPHIFERFYQVERGADRRTGGAGLGLYITRAYVHAMGGRIEVQSALGAGSRFTISLPVVESPQADATRRGQLVGVPGAVAPDDGALREVLPSGARGDPTDVNWGM